MHNFKHLKAKINLHYTECSFCRRKGHDSFIAQKIYHHPPAHTETAAVFRTLTKENSMFRDSILTSQSTQCACVRKTCR